MCGRGDGCRLRLTKWPGSMKAVKSLLKKKGASPPPAPAVTPDKLPVMERTVSDLPEAETDPVKLAVLEVLLSPAARTEKDEELEEKKIELLDPPEIQVRTQTFLSPSSSADGRCRSC